VYAGEAHARVVAGLGPFVLANISVDALLRVTTPFASAGAWRTDSNGLERHERRRDMRPWWPAPTVVTNEPVSSNVYPVLTAASIADAASGATLVLLPRGGAHGAASPADGVLDVTLARGVLASGNFPALANRHVTVEDALLLAPSEAAAGGALRPLAARLAAPAVVLVSAGAAPAPAFAPLAAPLPPAVELLSLALVRADAATGGIDASAAEQGPPPAQRGARAARAAPPPTPLANSTMLVRVRHIFAVGEGIAAQPVNVDLAALFAPRWTVARIREMTLTAAAEMDAARAAQVQWPQAGVARAAPPRAPASSASVTLTPMQIRTFLVDLV